LNSNPIEKNEKKIDEQGIENMFINSIIHDYDVEKKN
jgi:phosphoribosylformylglycinamidine (FGAM) synthase PurS component